MRPTRFSERRLFDKGSFTETFAATDPTTHETVALQQYLGSDFDQRQVFRALECLAASLHPTLLRLIGFFFNPSPGVPFAIATEFHKNGTLAEALKREQKGQPSGLNATQKSKLIFGVVAGMAFLHGHGILHRDLKPANIFLNDEFEPVIGDFDLSRYFDGGQNLEMQVGTPLFMAPELFEEDGIYDFAIDVYSFAITLYSIFAEPLEMDDGKGPARNLQQLQMRICRGVRFVKKVEIPDALWEVIVSCWKANPKERPTFQGLLDSFRGGQRYVFEGADRDAVIEYENRVYGEFGSPN